METIVPPARGGTSHDLSALTVHSLTPWHYSLKVEPYCDLVISVAFITDFLSPLPGLV